MTADSRLAYCETKLTIPPIPNLQALPAILTVSFQCNFPSLARLSAFSRLACLAFQWRSMRLTENLYPFGKIADIKIMGKKLD